MRYLAAFLVLIIFTLFSPMAFADPAVPEVAVSMAYDPGQEDGTDYCMACESQDMQSERTAAHPTTKPALKEPITKAEARDYGVILAKTVAAVGVAALVGLRYMDA